MLHAASTSQLLELWERAWRAELDALASAGRISALTAAQCAAHRAAVLSEQRSVPPALGELSRVGATRATGAIVVRLPRRRVPAGEELRSVA